MAQKCFLVIFENCAGDKGHGYLCRNSVSTTPGSCGVTLVIDGANTGIGERSAQIVQVSSPGSYPIPAGYEQNYGNECVNGCGAPPPEPTYDCINGNCVQASTYGTPGVYSSLADCQAACGGGCPPGQVCVEQACLDAVKAKLLIIQEGLS